MRPCSYVLKLPFLVAEFYYHRKYKIVPTNVEFDAKYSVMIVMMIDRLALT